MSRAARPRDIYRLPDQTRPIPYPNPPPPPPEPPRRRFPTWAVAGTVAAILIVSVTLRGPSDPSPDAAPIVDVVSEGQAVAALSLYSAQASAVANLQAREDIFASPGPADAAAAALRGAAEVQAALTAARSMELPDDSLAAVYWNSGEHTVVIDELNGVHGDARDIALLAATHDSLYGGTGAISLTEAYDQLNNRFFSPRHPVLNRWAEALVDQIEQQESMVYAVNFRESAGRMWAEQLGTLRPGAVQPLRRYLESLPTVTVDNLRGHPVAGPALEQLVQQSL